MGTSGPDPVVGAGRPRRSSDFRTCGGWGQARARHRAFAASLDFAVLAFAFAALRIDGGPVSPRARCITSSCSALLAPLLAIALPLRRAPAGAAFLVLPAALWAWHVPVILCRPHGIIPRSTGSCRRCSCCRPGQSEERGVQRARRVGCALKRRGADRRAGRGRWALSGGSDLRARTALHLSIWSMPRRSA